MFIYFICSWCQPLKRYPTHVDLILFKLQIQVVTTAMCWLGDVLPSHLLNGRTVKINLCLHFLKQMQVIICLFCRHVDAQIKTKCHHQCVLPLCMYTSNLIEIDFKQEMLNDTYAPWHLLSKTVFDRRVINMYKETFEKGSYYRSGMINMMWLCE